MPDRLSIAPLKRPFPGEQEALRLVDLSDVSGTIGSGSIVVFQDAPTFTGLVTFGGKIQADAGITAVGALSIFEREDSADNTILSVVALRRTTSAAGNGAAGLGAALLFELENDGGGTVVSAGRVTSRWTSPVAAVETSLLAFETRTGGGALTEHWQITGAGHFLAATDDTRDIGASGATRPRTGYFGTSVIVGDTVTINSTQVLATGALTIDPTTDLLVEATDNRARAFAVAEGARDYLVVSTVDAAESVAFGNATTNPTFGFTGGAVSLIAPTGGGAAFVLGTVAHFIESSHAAEAGSTTRNPGPLRWRARTWETTGGTSTTQTYLAFGATVDAITAATGVPTSVSYRWQNIPGTTTVMRLAADSTGVGTLVLTGDVTGVDEIAFTDAAASATAVGRLRRNAVALTWNGTLHVITSDASASAVSDVARFEHIVTSAAGANNIGVGVLFSAESTTGGTQIDLVRLDAVASDASVAAVTAGFGISTRTGGGALTKRWVVSGAGHFVTGVDNSYDIGDPDAPLRPRHLTLSGRLRTNRGADVTAASTLTLGDDGNFFEILGTTTINHMTTTGWQVGSMVIFVFAATVTVTNNAATPPPNTAPFFFSGGSSLSATAGDVLMLVLSDAGGMTAWTEVSRTII